MDALFELVQSLSPAEKGYFKKYAGRNESSETNTLRLFELIEEQSDYNEAALKKALGKEKQTNQFSVAKNYLYNALLKALTAYNDEHSLEVILRSYFSQIDILIHRGLYQQAQKIAGRAKLFAERVERFDALLQLNTIQRNLLLKIKPDDDSLSATELLKEFDALSAIEQQLSALEMAVQEQNRIMNDSMNVRSAEALNSNKRIFQKNNRIKPRSKRAQHLLCCVRLNYFLHADERAEAYNEAEKLLNICIGFEYFTRYETLSLLNAYNQFLHAAFYTGHWKELDKRLKELHQLQLRNEVDQVWQFCYYAPFALANYDRLGDRKAVYNLFGDTEKKLRAYSDKLRPDIFLSLIVAFSSGLLEYGEYAKAIDWIEIYRTSPRMKVHYDTQSSVLILQMIAHYESGNELLVTNLVKNMEYFVSRSKQKGHFERLAIRFFNALVIKAKSSKAMAVFTQLKEELDTLAAGDIQNKNRVIFPVLSCFIQSKIAQQPYHKFLQKH